MNTQDYPAIFRSFAENLAVEGRRLSNKELALSMKERFMDIVYMDNNRCYTFARIELTTGDIYSQAGKKPQGNIFTAPWYGFDAIGAHGVIVNNNKYLARVEQLRREKEESDILF